MDAWAFAQRVRAKGPIWSKLRILADDEKGKQSPQKKTERQLQSLRGKAIEVMEGHIALQIHAHKPA